MTRVGTARASIRTRTRILVFALFARPGVLARALLRFCTDANDGTSFAGRLAPKTRTVGAFFPSSHPLCISDPSAQRLGPAQSEPLFFEAIW